MLRIDIDRGVGLTNDTRGVASLVHDALRGMGRSKVAALVAESGS